MRFGAFEVDVEAGELCKHGLKIGLQDQPFQVLALLLERPGQVVTREEVRKRLWASDTFVDSERGLNRAISRLREALGDSAENPRFHPDPSQTRLPFSCAGHQDRARQSVNSEFEVGDQTPTEPKSTAAQGHPPAR